MTVSFCFAIKVAEAPNIYCRALPMPSAMATRLATRRLPVTSIAWPCLGMRRTFLWMALGTSFYFRPSTTSFCAGISICAMRSLQNARQARSISAA